VFAREGDAALQTLQQFTADDSAWSPGTPQAQASLMLRSACAYLRATGDFEIFRESCAAIANVLLLERSAVKQETIALLSENTRELLSDAKGLVRGEIVEAALITFEETRDEEDLRDTLLRASELRRENVSAPYDAALERDKIAFRRGDLSFLMRDLHDVHTTRRIEEAKILAERETFAWT
jgi:hypothetical protein